MPFPTTSERHREVAGSRGGSRARDFNDKTFRRYIVGPFEDPYDAENYMINGGAGHERYPLAIEGQQLADYSWDEYEKDYWEFTYNYARHQLDVDQWRFSVDGTAGNIKLKVSTNTTSYGRPNETPEDFKNAINVQDGKVEGVDRIIPALKYTISYRLAEPTDPFVFTKLCAGITATTNSVDMLGCAVGELLFLGFNGEFSSDSDPELQFSWAVSANADLSIGDITGPIAKKGHQFLWTLFEDEESAGGDSLVQVPKSVYVEDVYPSADHLTVMGLILS